MAALVTSALMITSCGGGGATETTPTGGRESFKGTNLRVLLKEGLHIGHGDLRHHIRFVLEHARVRLGHLARATR
jgi:hypothetical protein